MNKVLEHILQGMRDSFSLLDYSPYLLPAEGGFREDARALFADTEKLAMDMTRTLKAHEQNNRCQG
jgi:hypothetical protein